MPLRYSSVNRIGKGSSLPFSFFYRMDFLIQRRDCQMNRLLMKGSICLLKKESMHMRMTNKRSIRVASFRIHTLREQQITRKTNSHFF